jgi:hypothetical protein
MASAAQRRADAVFRRAMDRMLGRLQGSDTLMRQAHAAMGARIREALPDASPSSVRALVTRHMRSFQSDRVRIVRTAVTEAARDGSSITPETARAVFGARGARAVSRLAPTISDPARLAQRIADRRFNGSMTVDRLSVARRFGRLDRRVVDGLSGTVQSSMRLGASARTMSTDLLASTQVDVRLPRYIRDMRELARTASPSEVKRAVRSQLARLRSGRLSQHDISGATRTFLRRMRTAQGQDIDRAVSEWVERRAHNQAMTIARTETAHAMSEAYVSSHAEKPWVVGMRWNLSVAHEVPDICDMYAAKDDFGLGAGGYPKEEVPSLAHPNDLCFFTAIIDEHYQDRELARIRGTPEPPRPWETKGNVSGQEWMRRQTPEMRRQILGPGRAAEFARRPGAVVNPDGSLNTLYNIQGRPPPPISAAPTYRRTGQGQTRLMGQRPTLSRVGGRRAAPAPADAPQPSATADLRRRFDDAHGKNVRFSLDEINERRAERGMRPMSTRMYESRLGQNRRPDQMPLPWRPATASELRTLAGAPPSPPPPPRPAPAPAPRPARQRRTRTRARPPPSPTPRQGSVPRHGVEYGQAVASEAAEVEGLSPAGSVTGSIRTQTRGAIRRAYPETRQPPTRGSASDRIVASRASRESGFRGRAGALGEVNLSAEVREDFAHATAALAEGNQPTSSGWNAIRTVVHEELHQTTRDVRRRVSHSGLMKWLEESSVEIRARQVVRHMSGGTSASGMTPNVRLVRGVAQVAGPRRGVSYSRWVDGFYGAVAEATGLEGAELEALIERAMSVRFSATGGFASEASYLAVGRGHRAERAVLEPLVRGLADGDQTKWAGIRKALRAAFEELGEE